MINISNIPLPVIRKIIEAHGYKYSHDKGGHEVWIKEGALRPIILQSHITPVPLHIIKQICRHLNVTLKDFRKLVEAGA